MKSRLAFAVTLASLLFSPFVRAQFLPPQSLPVGGNPFSVAAGDLNDDGQTDLVIPRLSNDAKSGFVSTLSGLGNGSFAPFQSIKEKIRPEAVALGDFNEDGHLDAALPDLRGRVAVLLGNGQGGFGAPFAYTTMPDSGFVATADLDNDGHLDLIVASDGLNQSVSSITILFGNGDGTFARKTTVQTGVGPRYVVAVDVNGDGKLDLIVANYFSNTVGILLGNGDGTFRPQVSYSASYSPDSIAVGDLNGDGKLDLVVLDAFRSPNGSNKGRISLLFGNGDGTFQPQEFLDAGGSPYGIVTGDFNNDGALDLAVTNSTDNTLSVFLGKGNGTFLAPTSYATDAAPLGLTVADLNNDGLPDIAVANRTAGTVDIFLNAGKSGILFATGGE